MKTTVKLLLFLSTVLLIFNSCFEGIIIEGNNEMTEANRRLPNFDQIYSEGSFNVIYTHGDSSGVKIVCESNILPYIETAVFNKKLDIKIASHVNISTHKNIDIYVTNPAVKKIVHAGSGNIQADSLRGKDVEITLSGSGNIYANFYGRKIETSVPGSGNIEIYGECDTLDATISGSGSIELEAFDCLYAAASIIGSGNAELTGNSEKAKFNILGSGRIKAYDFPVKKANVVITGSGSTQVKVSELLDAVISGSGNIYYIGNPEITISGIGSGRLINDN